MKIKGMLEVSGIKLNINIDAPDQSRELCVTNVSPHCLIIPPERLSMDYLGLSHPVLAELSQKGVDNLAQLLPNGWESDWRSLALTLRAQAELEDALAKFQKIALRTDWEEGQIVAEGPTDASQGREGSEVSGVPQDDEQAGKRPESVRHPFSLTGKQREALRVIFGLDGQGKEYKTLVEIGKDLYPGKKYVGSLVRTQKNGGMVKVKAVLTGEVDLSSLPQTDQDFYADLKRIHPGKYYIDFEGMANRFKGRTRKDQDTEIFSPTDERFEHLTEQGLVPAVEPESA